MTQVLLVWVGKNIYDNLQIAIDKGTWGYPSPQTAAIAVGDWVLFGTGVKDGPRQSPADWLGKELGEAVLGRITKSWYEDSTKIWETTKEKPAEEYKFRFDFEFVSRHERLPLALGINFSAEISEGLRMAGTSTEDVADKHGTILKGIQAKVAPAGGLLLLGGAYSTAVPFDPARFPGDLNVPTSGVARAEQHELRRLLLARGCQCALCGEDLPKELLVAAHIKKRSLCDDAEKRDLDNVAMLACKLGCDALYEEGYVSVDSTGTIVIPPSKPTLGGLSARLSLLAGRRCGEFRPANEKYFAWHYGKHHV